jgi:hypothetical protein
MFGKSQPAPPTSRDTDLVISLRDLDDARSVTPRTYDLPEQSEFVGSAIERLTRLIAAGATDVETIAVLDAEIAAELRLEHADLADQRQHHVRACKEIVTVAERNVKAAQRDLAKARTALDEASMHLDQLLDRARALDPHHRSSF